MNSHARQIIFEWRRNENLLMVWRSTLTNFRGNPKVYLYMKQSFPGFCDGFISYMRQTLLQSHPMPGISVAEQVDAFNREFVGRFSQFIRDHVLGDDKVPIFSVTDGLPTSRFGADHFAKKDANCILATWSSVATPGVQARDDKAATAGTLQSGGYNPYYGLGDSRVVTGVVFADQSHLNTSSHVSALLDDKAIVALNRDAPAWTTTAFGNATPASDARLLSRRIFRSNEIGQESGVRMGEVRLQRRALDRDISETLHGDGEMSGLNRGYDMTPLYCRVQQKQLRREFYEPNQKPAEFIFSVD